MKLKIGCCLFVLGLTLIAQQKVEPAQHKEAGFQIAGIVVDSVTEQPLAKTRVSIAPVTDRQAYTTVVTGQDGKFFFSGLVTGKYALAAQRRGYLARAFNQHDQYSSSIAVGQNIDSSNLVFRMAAEGGISGVVTEDQGDRIREAMVLLFQNVMAGGVRKTLQRTQVMTDEEGAYHFSHLPPGKYFVAAKAKPWYAQHYLSPVEANDTLSSPSGPLDGPASVQAANIPRQPSPLDVAYAVTFYPEATDPGGAMAIVLGPGERASADITLSPVPALHIPLSTGNSDDPAPRPSFSLVERSFDAPPISVDAETMQQPSGALELVGVAPGRYVMQISTITADASSEQTEKEVDISGAGAMEFLSDETARVPFKAVIHFENGELPPSQGTVLLRNKKSLQDVNANISSKGEAEFKQGVPLGSYEVSLQTNRGIFIESMSATGANVAGRTVETKDGAVKLDLLVGIGEGTVTGTAIRKDKGVAGVMVVLVPEDPSNNQVLFRRDQSDSDGTFTLANIVPGGYTVLAIEKGWDMEWANAEVLKRFMPQGEKVVVEPKGKYSIKAKVQ